MSNPTTDTIGDLALSIAATIGEYAVGIGLIAAVVCVLVGVVAFVLRPRRIPALTRVVKWTGTIFVVGVVLWLVILVVTTLIGSIGSE